MIGQIDAIENEQVDDIALLLAVSKQMDLIEIFNETVEYHGNWEGLDAGYIIAVWLRLYTLNRGPSQKQTTGMGSRTGTNLAKRNRSAPRSQTLFGDAIAQVSFFCPTPFPSREGERLLQNKLEVEEINELDFTDDRLGIILHNLSDDKM